jgi:uncharacterized protein (TIGR02598 family)
MKTNPPPVKSAARRVRVGFPRGFSLVEVVIALGIASFVLVALVGITAVGTNAGLDSRRDTEGGQIFEQIMGQLRTKPFSESQSSSEADPALFPLPALNVDAEEVFYLDSQNKVVPGDSAIRKVRILSRAPVALSYLDARSAPQGVPDRESLAFVTVEISPNPERAQSETTVYFAEICRLQQ